MAHPSAAQQPVVDDPSDPTRQLEFRPMNSIDMSPLRMMYSVPPPFHSPPYSGTQTGFPADSFHTPTSAVQRAGASMVQSANYGMEIQRSIEDSGFSGDPVQTSLVVTSAGDGHRRVLEQEISRNWSLTSNQPGGPGQPDGGSATGADNYGGSPSILRPAPARSSVPSRGRGRGRGAGRGGGSVGTYHNMRAASMPPATHALSAGSFPSSSYIPVPSSPFAKQVQTMVQEGLRGNEAQANINSKRRWEAADAALLRSSSMLTTTLM